MSALFSTGCRWLSLAGSLVASLGFAAEPAKPNVIFVLTDDLGYGDVGVFYQNSRNFAANRNLPAMKTPNLDAMASQGLRMERHYCPAPVCAPSRASLLLGVHQGHSNVRDNQFDKALANQATLGSVMKAAGYATATIGKWGLAGPGTVHELPAHPLRRGFDYFFGPMAHLTGHCHYVERFNGHTDNQGQALAIFENEVDVTADLAKCYSTDLFTARAKQWIIDHRAAHAEQPFFLYLAYIAPHAHLEVPTQAYPAGQGVAGGMQWLGTPGAMINTASGTIDSWIHPDYANETYDHDGNPQTPEIAWPASAKRHATMIRRVDDVMADLIATLEDLGIDEETLIVFTSDNGPHNEAGAWGSYTQDPRFFRSYGMMDGIKRDTWEAGIRMPTIVRWPTRVPAGRVSQNVSQFQDWMPTFAELGGVPAPFFSDGVSLVPDLTAQGTQPEGVTYLEYNGGGGGTPNYADFDATHRGVARNQMQVIFHRGFKAIRTNVGSNATPFRVYDVSQDPQETTDLAGQPEVPSQAELEARVLQVRRPSAAASRPYDQTPIPPRSVSGLSPGLAYRAHEGAFPWVPSFVGMQGASEGVTATPDLSARSREADIGIEFFGLIQVPTTGTYTFFLSTDTGAFVRLHDAQLIDADFGYSGGEQSGSIVLEAGYHPIRIHYRHGEAGTHALQLQWQGPGLAKQVIPQTAWFHEQAAGPIAPVAHDDAATTHGAVNQPGTPVVIDVLANDFDDETPEPLTIVAVDPSSHGQAEVFNGMIRYTPNAGFFGADRFVYTISDGESQASAEVTVRVIPSLDFVWLPFNETSGSVVHDATGEPLGSLVGFAAPGWTDGKIHGGLRFYGDGNADHVLLAGYKGITGTAARTVTFWMNADLNQGGLRSTMVSWGANNSSDAGKRFDINLNHSNNYVLRAEFNASGVNFTTAGRGNLRGAGWVHGAIVVPSGATVADVRGYLDGVLATATLEPSAGEGTLINTGNANDVRIGNDTSGLERPFRGVLDDVRIYPRALSGEEIAQLAAAGRREQSAQLWYLQNLGLAQPQSSDWLADRDADGLGNLLEYVLGGDPHRHDAGLAPAILASNGAKVYRFSLRAGALPESAWRVETSTTLAAGSWLPVTPSSVTSDPQRPGFERIDGAVPEDLERRFYRLRVTPTFTDD